MKRINYAFAAILATMSLTSCYERIDAGYEGMKVNLYGDGKGVDNVSLVTGAVWYNPLTEKIYQYPTFVQTVDYEPFSINAKDGSSFTVDPTISLKIVDNKSPEVFKKYRKDNITYVINTTLYNYVKNAFRIQLNNYTTDELVSKREEFEKAIEGRLTRELAAENFQLEQMTSGLQYPPTLVRAIDAKNEAVQVSMRIENEVKSVEAAAKKKVAEAEGNAKALKIKGDAEAEYNRKIAASLSPLIIQQNMIEKWNGSSVPMVTTNSSNGLLFNLGDLKK